MKHIKLKYDIKRIFFYKFLQYTYSNYDLFVFKYNVYFPKDMKSSCHRR